MTREEATAGIAYLVAATQGWNDEAVDVYIDQCTRFQDPGVFMAAMRSLSLHWNKPSRPMMYDVNLAYQSGLRNQEMQRVEIPEDTGTIPDLEVGVEIARRAYHEECRRQGRTGSDDIFDHWISVIGNKREARRERRLIEEKLDDEF